MCGGRGKEKRKVGHWVGIKQKEKTCQPSGGSQGPVPTPTQRRLSLGKARAGGGAGWLGQLLNPHSCSPLHLHHRRSLPPATHPQENNEELFPALLPVACSPEEGSRLSAGLGIQDSCLPWEKA